MSWPARVSPASPVTARPTPSATAFTCSVISPTRSISSFASRLSVRTSSDSACTWPISGRSSCSTMVSTVSARRAIRRSARMAGTAAAVSTTAHPTNTACAQGCMETEIIIIAMSPDERLEELRRRNRAAELGGGEERIRRQHKAGKKTARERLEPLLDPGSFLELDRFVVHQTHDFGMAEQRIPGDGVVTGPGVIRAVTHESVSAEDLGGATTHGTTSGVAHFASDSEEECLALIRELLTFLPQNNTEDPPLRPTQDPAERRDESLQSIVPGQPNKPYDMKEIVRAVLDDRYFFEVQATFAPNIVVGFGRLGGRPVGIVANQPAHLAGCLDIAASVKAARFVRFCDCFNVPLVTFVDVPGFLPGTAQEFGGIIKHGAKLLYAFCEAKVRKLNVITRLAYCGAYCGMSSNHDL